MVWQTTTETGARNMTITTQATKKTTQTGMQDQQSYRNTIKALRASMKAKAAAEELADAMAAGLN